MYKILFSSLLMLFIWSACNSSKPATDDTQTIEPQAPKEDIAVKADTISNIETNVESEKQPDTIYIKIDKALQVTFNDTIVATSFSDKPTRNLLNNLLKEYLIRSYTDHKTLPAKLLYKYDDDKAKVIFKNLDDAVSTAQLQVISYIEKKEKKPDFKKYPILTQTKFY